jgi:hypothetical protein
MIMKKSLFFFLSIFCLVLLSTSTTFAQKSKTSTKKEPKDVTSSYKYSKKEKERNAILDKLWYGSGGALHYYRANQYSVAQFGLSPMVGYKFNSIFSAGPRLEFNDYYIKGFAVDGEVHKGNAFSYGAGLFARAKILRQFFIHAEIGYKQVVLPTVNQLGILDLDADDPTKIARTKGVEYPVLLGVGYNMGIYEIYATWDFNRKNLGVTELPIDYRIGFTWKF